MSDYIVRAMAANQQIRAFAATTKNLVEHARSIHGTSPVATAALGRLLTAGAMMGASLKGEKDLLTLQIKGDGPLNGLTVTTDSSSNVKGYVNNPTFVNPPNFMGKFDVGGAIGYGTLRVIRDMGLKEPYVGETDLITGEIAEDLTYYFAKSEQIPTAVGLGVLMNKENTVRQAGGFIIQLMPFAEDSVIDELEKRINEINSVTSMLEDGLSPEGILEKILEPFGVEFTDTVPTAYKCNCSRERVTKALISVGRKELESMIDEGKDVELNCHFCNTNYTFSIDDIKKLIK
ncbi:MAG: Hsp33 family molecular chaperone HslO [Lachnospiraceae bacterium]|nr:Hsp33 family molecular chaperone HslO [Lachnospiraceae bacterium]